MKRELNLIRRVEFGFVVDGRVTGANIIVERQYSQHREVASISVLLSDAEESWHFRYGATCSSKGKTTAADKRPQCHEALRCSEEISHLKPRFL
ncbi:hypothetical protein D3C71_933220 [compost metagenome]